MPEDYFWMRRMRRRTPWTSGGTQLAALRWVQLLGVRGSGIHAGLKQAYQRAAESVFAGTVYLKKKKKSTLLRYE